MKFSDTENKEFKFYGAEFSSFKIDEYVFEAIEDEADGYRSHLDTIEIRKSSNLIFFREPVANVKVVDAINADIDGYSLVDVSDGHIWLTVGTNNSDEWYPWFVFEYQPKKPDGLSL